MQTRRVETGAGRVGGHSFLLALSLDSDLKGYSRRPRRTSPEGKVATIARVADPRAPR